MHGGRRFFNVRQTRVLKSRLLLMICGNYLNFNDKSKKSTLKSNYTHKHNHMSTFFDDEEMMILSKLAQNFTFKTAAPLLTYFSKLSVKIEGLETFFNSLI